MNELETQPDASALPSTPSDELWTSDSQRADTASTTELAPDEPPAAEPAVIETPAVEQTAAERDETGKFKPRSGKPRNDPQARVQQATAKEAAAKEDARLAREETAALKARLDAIEAERRTADDRRAEPRVTDDRREAGPKFPTFDTWSAQHPEADYDDYIDARADFRFEQRDQTRSHQQAIQAFHREIDAAIARDPVMAAAVKNPPPASAVMNAAILQSPKRIDIVRYLSTHPEDCAQLARESQDHPLDAAPLMRRYLESQVTAGAVARPDSAPAVQPSTANPPINRVGGTASATPIDPEDLDFGPDYIRQENAREKKRQELSRW